MRTTKQRKPRSIKINGEPSLDMCSCCISFYCDPMSMSTEFRTKIRNRMRMHLCPACGQPNGFCQCKSSIQQEKTGRLITHNNKKLRRAWAEVHDRERAYQEWSQFLDVLYDTLGEQKFSQINYALYHHNVPPVPWKNVAAAIVQSGANMEIIHFAWCLR